MLLYDSYCFADAFCFIQTPNHESSTSKVILHWIFWHILDFILFLAERERLEIKDTDRRIWLSTYSRTPEQKSADSAARPDAGAHSHGWPLGTLGTKHTGGFNNKHGV